MVDVEVGVRGAQTHASWPRLALGGVGWAAYFAATCLAIGAVLTDSHPVTGDFPAGRVAVAATAVMAVVAASRFTRRMRPRPRWAHPVALRIAALAALVATATYGGWQAHRADVAVQQRVLADYTHRQQQIQTGLQRVDALLAPGRAGALTRYTAAPCQSTAGVVSDHCWTSPQTTETVIASLRATLTSAGAEHLVSHCQSGTDSCALRGELAGMRVWLNLLRVTAPSCHCPGAAGNPTTRTLITVLVIPALVPPRP